MIVKIKTELCISAAWVTDSDWSHGVSGHIYEIIEYFYLLSKKYSITILLGDSSMSETWFKKIIQDKYNFNQGEVENIITNTIFCNKPPRYVIGNKILFVDGCLVKMQTCGIRLFFDKIYSFKCSKYEQLVNLDAYDVIPLLDYRVYEDVCNDDVKSGINYIKKMLIDSYNSIICKDDSAMLYLTRNCRLLPVEQVMHILNKYMDNFNNYIIITDSDIYNNLPATILNPPVDNIFTKFGTYIYTPTTMRWDGSPRFPVECKLHEKKIILEGIDEAYLNHDKGLMYRLQDMQSLDNINLTQSDAILDII
jgi:hypothetical protein